MIPADFEFRLTCTERHGKEVDPNLIHRATKTFRGTYRVFWHSIHWAGLSDPWNEVGADDIESWVSEGGWEILKIISNNESAKTERRKHLERTVIHYEAEVGAAQARLAMYQQQLDELED